MTLRDFAEKYRARVNDRRHESEFRLNTTEDTIHGRYGEIAEEPSYGPAFVVKFIAVPRNRSMDGALLNRFRAATAAPLRLKFGYGNAESTFLFDPTNDSEAKLALKLVGAKFRKNYNLTMEQKQERRKRLESGKVSKQLENNSPC